MEKQLTYASLLQIFHHFQRLLVIGDLIIQASSSLSEVGVYVVIFSMRPLSTQYTE